MTTPDDHAPSLYDVICMRLMHGTACSIRDYLATDPADAEAAITALLLADQLAAKLDALTAAVDGMEREP